MKIGVALSGCDLGGISAYRALGDLREMGLEIAMISACCVPAAPALLYAYGSPEKKARKSITQFLKNTKEIDMDFAVAEFAATHRIPLRRPKIPVAVHAVDVAGGDILTFTNDFTFKSETLSTTPLEDTYDALSATISRIGGLGCYHYKNHRLCDFCCWYGCPVYPLKMAGLQKIISLSFLPRQPKMPYEVLAKQKIAASAQSAQVCISIEFEDKEHSIEEYEHIASEEIEKYKKNILLETIF